jgi:hypothetical protein
MAIVFSRHSGWDRLVAELEYIAANRYNGLAAWRLVIWEVAERTGVKRIDEVHEAARYGRLRSMAKTKGFSLPTEARVKNAVAALGGYEKALDGDSPTHQSLRVTSETIQVQDNNYTPLAWSGKEWR